MNRSPAATMALLIMFVTAIPVHAYVTSRRLSSTNTVVQIKWAKVSAISWQMNPTPANNISGSREQGDVIRQSFKAWSSIPTADVAFTEGPATISKLAYEIGRAHV